MNILTVKFEIWNLNLLILNVSKECAVLFIWRLSKDSSERSDLTENRKKNIFQLNSNREKALLDYASRKYE